MPPLSSSQFEANIKPGSILRFSEAALNTPIPHYFICVAVSPPDELIFSCCTSRFETVRRLIERNRYPNSTLVHISPTDAANPFDMDTYVNCNEYFPYTINELWQKYLHSSLSFHGDLPAVSFEQILIGFKDSNVIEEYIKESLPDIDDL